jgi:hypothetical protein
LDSYLIESRINLELIALIRSSQFRRILELAWGRFHWQRSDHARRKQHNPRGYLYRRLRELLQRNPYRFVVFNTSKKFPCYIPADESSGRQPQPPLFRTQGDSVGYGHWSPPPPAIDLPPEKYLFKDTWLLDAADFFWQQAMKQAGPVMIPIRELSRYLADHHPWLNAPLRREGTDSDGVDELADERETPEQHLQRINGLQSVAPLAAQLAATWPMDQQRVFVLRLLDPPATYEEIAARLGLADHNRAYALYRKAVQSLQRFTNDWPGLPLAELPEEVAHAFIEEMKRLCKNSLLCP